MAEPTPIETLEQLFDDLMAYSSYTEAELRAARLALERVGAVVDALRRAGCSPTWIDPAGPCHTRTADIDGWCPRCAALVPFGKEGP